MTIWSKNFDDISESDLMELIASGVPEGAMMDYKREAYGGADKDIKEFLKDVASFENSSGGHLIIGIAEEGGIPVELTPMIGVDPDKELQRMESLVQSGIEPRIVGIRLKSVSVSTGGYAFVIRVPKSWNPPHRVSAKGTNRFYIRSSAGAYEASVDELREVFTRLSTVQDRVRVFRSERLSRIGAGEAQIPLREGNGNLVVHLIPFSAFGIGEQVDIKKLEELHMSFLPFRIATSLNYNINSDGFINFHGVNHARGYVQIFRSGIVEVVECDIISNSQGRKIVSPSGIEASIMKRIIIYIDAMRLLEVSPPIVMMVNLMRVRGVSVEIGDRFLLLDSPIPINREVLDLPEVLFEDFGSSAEYEALMRPIFNALWNSAGIAKSPNFDENGRWINR
jgi:hypothetical protein